MPSENACHRWIFREGRSSVQAENARAGLVASLASLGTRTHDGMLDALIRCGEMEAALADTGAEDADEVADLTNSVAAALLGVPRSIPRLTTLASRAERLRLPERFDISISEGFAYYALDPLGYADAMNRIDCGAPVALVGIRSIGTTLSAVVWAALVKKGIRAERTTVRPIGHPYDRKTEFTPEQHKWIARHRARQAEFLVVDEGPGLSGSSFLSVGEALLAAGVERRRIRFVCSRSVDPDKLASENGAERWRGFQTVVGSSSMPAEDLVAGSGLLPPAGSDADPGATWVQMERAKFLSRDGRRLFKFAGLGRYGSEVGERARLLADTGFGPEFYDVRGGYAEYEVMNGRPARPQDLTSALLERFAEYCAMRAAQFRVTGVSVAPLEQMARYNYEQEFGETAPDWLRLDAPASVVLCDARLLPHEWIISGGFARKTDGETHGDDHFFPGPCDIAWDLGGAIVEWGMDADAEEYFLRHYLRITGDDPASRIASYALAYSVFRMSYCTMAASAAPNASLRVHLTRCVRRYRDWIARATAQSSPALARRAPQFSTCM